MDVKLVVVGDGAVGKTCMLVSYTDGTFPKGYVPTVFDNYEATISVNEKPVKYSLWDTAGQETYKRIRTLSYPNTDIFLVCFSVVDRPSFMNIRDRWYSELKHHCPHVPFILVGTKCDLVSDEQSRISLVEAESLAAQVGAIKYMECSALTREGVEAVFNDALMVAVQNKTPKKQMKHTKRMCSVM